MPADSPGENPPEKTSRPAQSQSEDTATHDGGATLPQPPQATRVQAADDFFSAVEMPAKARGHGDSEGAGEVRDFGDYELLDKLGEGGMGFVYLARQKSANRLVALKIIRPERLSALEPQKQEKIIQRFKSEAQAAAQLEHDNIVTVYDVGQIDQQQYFSMRYVAGQSLADVIRHEPLDSQSAARYLAAVAHAVHEAHQHGILHRDLKPQNILIDEKTDRALVADFGLAKLTEQDTELTRAGEVMGTPQYMSPEQARDSGQVTEQSDVYSLGATLFHVLVGRPVFQAASPIETLRQVLDETPVPPRRINPAIDQDLDTICMKCLEKEAARRYDSSLELARELERFLNGEPIQARPLGALARGWRWSRRNPLVAGMISVTVGCLVAVSIVMTAAYINTAAAQRRSEESFRQALDMVNVFFTRVSEETLLDQPGLQPLRQDLLMQAREYYERFLKQRAGDATLRDQLAETHYRIGLITAEIDSPDDALTHYDRALEIQKQLDSQQPIPLERVAALANTQNAKAIALYKLDQIDESLALFQASARHRATLIAEQPEDAEYQRKLANTIMNIGVILQRQDELLAAREQFERAQQLRDQLYAQDAGDAKLLRDLAKGAFHFGDLLMVMGDFAVDQGEDEQSAGYFTEAAANIETAISKLDELRKLEVTIDDRYYLGICYFSLARIEGDVGNAIERYQTAIGMLRPLTDENPNVDKLWDTLAGVHLELADCYLETEANDDARQSLAEAISILKSLVHTDPTTTHYSEDLISATRLLAETSPLDDYNQTLIGLLDDLIAEFPEVERFRAARKKIEGKDAGKTVDENN